MALTGGCMKPLGAGLVCSEGNLLPVVMLILLTFKALKVLKFRSYSFDKWEVLVTSVLLS